MGAAARAAGVLIVTGDTKIVERGAIAWTDVTKSFWSSRSPTASHCPAGISLLRSGQDAICATGAKLLLPHYMGLLATAPPDATSSELV